MIYKNGERMRAFLFFYCSLVFYILGCVFNKTIIPLALVGYEMIIANSALRANQNSRIALSNDPVFNN